MSKPVDVQQGISLKSILPEAKFYNADDIMVRSCCGKWEECQSGDMFVAIIDSEIDGHLFTQRAEQQGAKAILGERLVRSDLPMCVVPDSRKAYARLCQSLAGSPARHLKTIGVTGSHGKTSVCQILDHVLSAGPQRVGRFDSTSACVSGQPLSSKRPTWTPPQIASNLARFVLEDCSHAIVEVPSTCLATHATAGLEWDIAILTNLRRQHLDVHGSVKNYRRVKLRLLEQLKDAGVAIINADDPVCHQLVDQLKVPTLTFGMHQEANVQAQILESHWGEQTFLITAGSESVVVHSSIVGRQHIYNCLAAVTAALAAGMDLPTIARGLQNCQTLEGRFQAIYCGQSFKVMVDAADNAEQLAVALNVAKNHCSGRVICVATYDQDQQTCEQRLELGRILDRRSHLPVITSAGKAGHIDYEPTHQILDGFRKPNRAQVIPDRIRAIEWALAQAGPDDIVVVTGKGERPIATVDQERWHVTDAEVCRAWLYENAEPVEETAGFPDIFHIDDFREI